MRLLYRQSIYAFSRYKGSTVPTCLTSDRNTDSIHVTEIQWFIRKSWLFINIYDISSELQKMHEKKGIKHRNINKYIKMLSKFHHSSNGYDKRYTSESKSICISFLHGDAEWSWSHISMIKQKVSRCVTNTAEKVSLFRDSLVRIFLNLE